MSELIKQIEELIASDINEALKNDSDIFKNTDIKANDLNDLSNVFDKLEAVVNKEIADEVLERAKYYCPVDSGRLRDSGHIVYNKDTCSIIFDTHYAYYVHEATWVKHEFPTCAKFLDRAIFEVSTFYNLGG